MLSKGSVWLCEGFDGPVGYITPIDESDTLVRAHRRLCKDMDYDVEDLVGNVGQERFSDESTIEDEIKAIRKIGNTLETLDRGAKVRVLAWVLDRNEISPGEFTIE